MGVTADHLGLQRLQPVHSGRGAIFSRVKQPYEGLRRDLFLERRGKLSSGLFGFIVL